MQDFRSREQLITDSPLLPKGKDRSALRRQAEGRAEGEPDLSKPETDEPPLAALDPGSHSVASGHRSSGSKSPAAARRERFSDLLTGAAPRGGPAAPMVSGLALAVGAAGAATAPAGGGADPLALRSAMAAGAPFALSNVAVGGKAWTAGGAEARNANAASGETSSERPRGSPVAQSVPPDFKVIRMEPDQTHPGAEPSLGARAGSAANPILQAADQWLKMPVAAAFGGRSSTGAIFDQGSDGVSPSIVELPRGSVRSQAAAESALGALRSRPGSGAGADHRTIEARLLRAADSDAVGLLDRPLGDQAAEAFAGVEVGESELPLKLTHAPRAPAIGLTAPLHQVDLGTNPSSASGASIAAVADAALSQVTPSDRAGMSESAVGIGAAASRMSDRAELATAQVRSALSNVGDASLIEIRLDPPELGRVEIRMDVTDDTLRATVSADRTVTVEALRRNSESLLQALREAGFSSVDLSFGHFAEHRRRDSERREHGPATLPFEREGGVPKVAVDRDRTPFRPIPAVGVWNGSGGLDMTI